MYLHTYYVHDPYLFKNTNDFKYIKKEDMEKNSFLPITDDKYTEITPEFKTGRPVTVETGLHDRVPQSGAKRKASPEAHNRCKEPKTKISESRTITLRYPDKERANVFK